MFAVFKITVGLVYFVRKIKINLKESFSPFGEPRRYLKKRNDDQVLDLLLRY